jgi:hypothetical protein
VLEATGAYAIRAFFVFLDLLERHAEKLAQLALAHAEHRPAHSQPRPDVDIDYVRRFSHKVLVASIPAYCGLRGNQLT